MSSGQTINTAGTITLGTPINMGSMPTWAPGDILDGSRPSAVTKSLSITEIAQLLTALWQQPNSPPVLLIGPPGGGKTSIVGQVAKTLGMHYEVLMGNTLEPSDVAGIPHLKDGELVLAPPAWSLRLRDKVAVLNFDELNTARPATLAALLRVILERRVGDIQLGEHVHVIATMNPAEEAAHGWELPPAVANRFLHIDVAPTSVGDWKKWARGLDETATFHQLVEAFSLPALYSTPGSGPFASPRSWYFALKAAALMVLAGRNDLIGTVVAAAVSPGVALSWADAQRASIGSVTDWSQVDPGEVGLHVDRAVEEIRTNPTDEVKDRLWQMVLDAAPFHSSTLYVKLGAHKAILRTNTTALGVEAMRKVQEAVK